MDLSNKIKAAAEYIKGKSKYNPTIGLILGSGLGAIADQIEDAEYFPYNEIPNFPVSTVEGHAGRLVIGKFQGKEVVAMQGRFHYYEGYSMQEVTCPVRVMRLLGVETLVVTNAAGAVNKDYTPGDLMIISDHLNLSGSNPLIGKNLNEFGTRFPDMSNADEGVLTKLPIVGTVICKKEPLIKDTGSKEFNINELSNYNGKNGKPPYIAIFGTVYDLTDVDKWQEKNIKVGCDLTGEYKEVYGNDKSHLKNLKVAGVLTCSLNDY